MPRINPEYLVPYLKLQSMYTNITASFKNIHFQMRNFRKEIETHPWRERAQFRMQRSLETSIYFRYGMIRCARGAFSFYLEKFSNAIR